MTTRVHLTRGYEATVDDEDAERALAFKWFAIGRDGHVYAARHVWFSRGPAERRGRNRLVYLHRFILGAEDGAVHVDHRNGDRLDCRRGNLRTCTHAQNLCNTKLRGDNVSGFKGVSRTASGRPWRALITISGRLTSLGRFDTKEEAAAAYDRAARDVYGEFARTNEVLR